MNSTLKLLGIIILKFLDMCGSLSGHCFHIQKVVINLYRAYSNTTGNQSEQQR